MEQEKTEGAREARREEWRRICVKRLEKGTFSWPAGVEVENGKLRLGGEALALLLDGVDLKGAKMRPWYQRE